MNKNYKDDFILAMHLLGVDGKPMELPDVDFSVALRSGSSVYMAGRINGEYRNCRPDENNPDTLLIIADNHKLRPAARPVSVEIIWHIPDAMMPDGVREVAQHYPTDLILTIDHSDLPSCAQIAALAPFIKGDPFTYADLTDEEKADLSAPIITESEKLREETANLREESAALRRESDELRERSRIIAHIEFEGDETIARVGVTDLQMQPANPPSLYGYGYGGEEGFDLWGIWDIDLYDDGLMTADGVESYGIEEVEPINTNEDETL